MKCKTKFCRKESKRSGFCSACSSRDYRKRNPIRCAFIQLKSNAKRRGKPFDLTLIQFNDFCVETDYIHGKGKTKQSYSIGRIDDSVGYTIDNIRVLSLSDNVKKERARKVLIYDYEHPEQTHVVTRKKFVHNHDDPF